MTAIDFVHSYWKQGAARRTAKGVASLVTSLPKAKAEGRATVIAKPVACLRIDDIFFVT